MKILTDRMKSPNAVFLFRDSEMIKDIPEKHISRFKDTDPLYREQLKVFWIFLMKILYWLLLVVSGLCHWAHIISGKPYRDRVTCLGVVYPIIAEVICVHTLFDQLGTIIFLWYFKSQFP